MLHTNDIFSMLMSDFVSDEKFQGVKPKNPHLLPQIKCLQTDDLWLVM